VESLQGSDALLTIAEVLVALAAASGIVLALTRDPERWEAFDAVRVFQLLASSLGGTFLALLPFGLHFAGLGDPEIWRIASGAMVALVLAVAAFGLRMFRTAYGASSQSFRLWLLTLLSLIGLLNLGAQILNGLAIVFDGSLSVFLGRVQSPESCRLTAAEHPVRLLREVWHA
jgi:hypothetical protein